MVWIAVCMFTTTRQYHGLDRHLASLWLSRWFCNCYFASLLHMLRQDQLKPRQHQNETNTLKSYIKSTCSTSMPPYGFGCQHIFSLQKFVFISILRVYKNPIYMFFLFFPTHVYLFIWFIWLPHVPGGALCIMFKNHVRS